MSEENIRKLIRQRGSVKAKLTSFIKFLTDFCTNLELDEQDYLELKIHYNQAQELSREFDRFQSELEVLVDDADLNDQYAERETFNKNLARELSKAEKVLVDHEKRETSSSSSGAASNAHNQQTSVKLTPIEVPKFKGDYESWLEFRETFESLIHTNNYLTDTQKYHYLKVSLLGNAAEVIASLEFSGANYPIAWDLLTDRYNNQRLLIQNHIKAIFGMEMSSKESSKNIRNIIDSMSKHLKALKQLHEPTEYWDTLIIYIITSRLDEATVREWEQSIAQLKSPSLGDFKSFLKAKADLLETIELKNADARSQRKNKCNTATLIARESVNKNQGSIQNHGSCALCKHNTHFIRNCQEFLKLSISQRIERVKALKLCSNCLRYGHKCADCRFSNCQKCNGRHNTLLHLTPSENRVDNNINNNVSTTLNVYHSQLERTLLSTALIQITSPSGVYTARAILDSASQSSFITSTLCAKLKMNTEKISLAVAGINDITSEIKCKCDINIESLHSAYNTNLTCLVIDNISGILPSSPIDTSRLKIPKNVPLADASFGKPGPVDILIGADLFWDLISIGQIKLGDSLPILQKTVLGWIISGPLGSGTRNVQCNFLQNLDIQAQLSKFWELEECSNVVHLSADEQLCENHYIKHTTRNNDGRFVVKIPFKTSLDQLGESKSLAEKRFLSLERKMKRNNIFRNEYVEFMREYEDLGHMRKISEDNISKITYYMPHHGVLKETSLTTRLRVVFDCSAVTSSGFSLNDLQTVGPTIQRDLFSILIQFRTYTFVITADIAKMYRQVLVSDEQRSLQRILWRYSDSEPVDTYELQTVTYGMSSASYLAIRSLYQLALNCENNYPEISQIIKNNFYVDDLLFGSNNIELASSLAIKLSEILRAGGFELRKWHSNSREIIHNITSKTSNVSNENAVLEIGKNETTKTLGLAWSSSTDQLTYNVGLTFKDDDVTKRVILSSVSQIFDPLGLLSPCIITIKILLQKLWLERLGWDDPVPDHIGLLWLKFRSEIPLLKGLQINRHVICEHAKLVEIHCFCDASEQAYGSCLYIRSIDEANNVHVSLMCSKTKVAPLKIISVPRLELCGALLSARLARKVKLSLHINIDSITFWTDSTIILGWIKSPPHSLKTFVANRVAEIQELSADWPWRHVPTKQNPADILSRGISIIDIKDSNLWWNGPNWLMRSKDAWPESKTSSDTLPELKTTSLTIVKIPSSIIDFSRFSSFIRLKRTMAYVLRFINNCKNIRDKRLKGFTTLELDKAYTILLKLAQLESYSEEIALLTSGRDLTAKSKLFNLNPFIDERELLRVGGRLSNSSFHYDKKHPIIISAKHALCKLIFKYEHVKMLHAGPQLLLSNIKSSIWPVGGRNLSKITVRNCVTCFRFTPKTILPIMGDLPQKRLEATFPFNVCGVDYAGPFLIKDRKGRGCKTSKCYLALFVCFAVKAVHLELVTDLTTEGFLLALKRFMSRRGKPARIYSDNGSNFVGANSELRSLGEFLRNNEETIPDSCVNDGVEWHFIPAHSPHFGGLWEAGIKSSKHHFKRVVGNSTLTFEELYTVFAQIEAVLNSRPILPLSSDPNDLHPLTPAHFIVGKALVSTPEASLEHVPLGRLSRFQLIEQIRQNFWTRWSKEYISEMQQRSKWPKSSSQAHENALVLVKEDNLNPMQWRMGRIVSLHPGKDGVSRVATIKTAKGVLTRACSKICPLPVESEPFQGRGHVEESPRTKT